MISDYFYDQNKKHTEEEKIEFTQTRINELKDYIRNKIFKTIKPIVSQSDTFTSDHNTFKSIQKPIEPTNWDTTSNKNFIDPSKDRFYINHNYFEQFTSEWTQKTKVKLERIDWLYLIYQVVITRGGLNPGYNVSWANGTLGIHLDKPDICR